MPLHLLGKKSWNVYNKANIERVKRDEADAKDREEAEEQRLQAEDAAWRARILRGEEPSLSVVDKSADQGEDKSLEHKEHDNQSRRKRRRLHGEDDTDRDIRWAQEDAAIGQKVSTTLSKRSKDDSSLVDDNGHIQLVPVPDPKQASKIEKNAEAEAEKARKSRELEEQYTMRFSNAAGFKNGLQAPWYAERREATSDTTTTITPSSKSTIVMPEKDIWGNADPRRREREQNRVVSNDPLAFMQRAQQQLKQSERDKERWKAERAAELRDLERDEASRRHHKRRGFADLEPLSLDAPMDASIKDHHIDRHRRHHKHEHRHRRRQRSSSRH